MLYTKGIDPSVKTFRSLTDGIDHRWKNLIFDRFYRSIGLRFFFLMTTIDLIDVFCRQSIIGINPIVVFLTIGAQLWVQLPLPSGPCCHHLHIYVHIYKEYVLPDAHAKLSVVINCSRFFLPVCCLSTPTLLLLNPPPPTPPAVSPLPGQNT